MHIAKDPIIDSRKTGFTPLKNGMAAVSGAVGPTKDFADSNDIVIQRLAFLKTYDSEMDVTDIPTSPF